MNGQKAMIEISYIQFNFTEARIRECAEFCGVLWDSNNTTFVDSQPMYGIKQGYKQTSILHDRDYIVKDAVGNITNYDEQQFNNLMRPVQGFEGIRQWTEDTTGPFEKSDAVYPRIEITADHLKLSGENSHPVNTFSKEMHKHVNKSQKKILEPDTIANLIQSNLERNLNGYSIDALSRTMLGRTGKREPR